MQDPETRSDDSVQKPVPGEKSVLIETLQLAARNLEASVVNKFNTFLAQNFKGMDEAKQPFSLATSVREIAYLRKAISCLREIATYLDDADPEQMKKTYKKGTAQECISDFRKQMMSTYEICEDI